MNDTPKPGPADAGAAQTSAAARMLIEEMQRERRSFWGILAVFFLLLAGIGALIIYTTYRVTTGEYDSRRQQFLNMGASAEALTGLLNQQNTASIEQKRLEREQIAAQRMIGVNVATRNGSTVKYVPHALDFARRHFMGEPLNMSSGSVVAAVLELGAAEASPLSGDDRTLLRAAMADWTQDDATLETLAGQLADVPVARGDHAIFGHIAKARLAFDRAADIGYDWDGACAEAVAEVKAAQEAGAIDLALRFEDQGLPEAAGLNLDYWQGQCLRRHGDTRPALAAFNRMLAYVREAGDALPDSNPFKFQAYHGVGTVMTTAIDDRTMAPEEKAAYIADAKLLLETAAKLRRANGATETGSFGSLENVSFLLFREDEPERLVDVLEHTGFIDEKISMTWNLVARLAAARSLLSEGFPAVFARPDMQAKYDALADKYSEGDLKRIMTEALAKLSRRDISGLAQIELKKLLGPDYAPSVDIAARCVELREACFSLDPMKAPEAASEATPETAPESEPEAVPAAAPEATPEATPAAVPEAAPVAASAED
ncbi:MAG: hypothetical protein R3C52_00895 [Hyphomonadaceae bacterium]